MLMRTPGANDNTIIYNDLARLEDTLTSAASDYMARKAAEDAKPANQPVTFALPNGLSVVVIPDRFGGFEHNAAIHLVGRDGRLVEISDLDQPLAFAGKVREKL